MLLRKALILLLLDEVGAEEGLETGLPGHGLAAYGIQVAFPDEQVVHVVDDGFTVHAINLALLVEKEVPKVEVEGDVLARVVQVLSLELVQNLQHIGLPGRV